MRRNLLLLSLSVAAIVMLGAMILAYRTPNAASREDAILSTTKRDAPRAQRANPNLEPVPRSGLAAPTVPLVAKGVVSGIVTDLEGKAAPGAKVRLMSGGVKGTASLADGSPGETNTAADGSYHLEGIPDGLHWVSASTEDSVGDGGFRIIEAEEQWRVANVDIVLKPISSLPMTRGTVRGPTGDPIEGASVSALSLQTSDWPLANALPAFTNEDGVFEIRFLDKRQQHGMNHSLEAIADGYAASQIEGVEAGSSGNDITLRVGGTVSGRVTFAENGTPAAGAKVLAMSMRGNGPEGQTDADGTYVIAGLTPGLEYILMVEPKEDGLVPIDTPLLTVSDGEERKGLDITLSEGGSVSGTVTVLETNSPLSGVRVRVDGGQWNRIRRETETDHDGNYMVPLLPAGTYAIHCENPRGVRPAPNDIGTLDREGIVLGADENKQSIDFQFDMGIVISGRVTDVYGKRIEGARLTAGSNCESVTGPDGKYQLTGLKLGEEYWITTHARGYVPMVERFARTIKMSVEKDFVLHKGTVISGKVVDTDGTRLPNCEVRLMPEPDVDLSVSLAHAETDEEGRFAFEDGAPKGQYSFEVHHHQRSRRIPLPVRSRPIDVFREDQIADVEVVVLVGQGVVSGHVRDAKGVGLERIVIHATSDTGSEADAFTDAAGRFCLTGLSGTTAELEVRSLDPDWLGVSMGNVSVGTEDVNVVLTRNGGVSGFVLDSVTGAPVREFLVETSGIGLERKLGVRPSCYRDSSEDGAFVLEGVAPGAVTLDVNAPGYEVLTLTGVQVEAGRDTADVVANLIPLGAVEGVVVLNGQPIDLEGMEPRLAGSRLDSDAADSLDNIDSEEEWAEGYFKISGLAEGNYELVLSFGASQDARATFTREVTIEAGQVTPVSIEIGNSRLDK